MSNGDDTYDDDLDDIVEWVRSASIDGILRTIHLDGARMCNDFEKYLDRLRSRVIREVQQQLKQLNGVKVQIKLVAEYHKPKVDAQVGGALERARRAAKRRKYEKNEVDKTVATIGLTTKLTPITHKSDVRQTVERLLADNRLAREILGWEPRVGLEDGLKRTIAWIKKNEEKYRSGVYVV